MAGKQIKGITIEIDGDTSKLGKALADVEKRSRERNSSLKDIEKNLKFNPGNTELVAQQAGLNGFSKSNQKQKEVKNNNVIAREVIAGQWGNGDERVRRLAEAGYNAIKIQTTVNGILNEEEYIEIAKRVINGDYGNGYERKKKLADEGYDYYKVQEKVNQLL